MATQYLNAALTHYRHVGNAAAFETEPQKLIEMLLAGVLDRLAKARGCMTRGERPEKLHYISSAISIIEHLRLVVDVPAGGALAENLVRLYEYMLRRLPAANVADDVSVIDEVSSLLREIKSAWDCLPSGATRH
jgi:flagellar secretion chaperone FliS